MSKVVVEFKTDNAAFRDDETGDLDRYAVSVMLTKAADKIEDGAYIGALIDVNGNTVGRFSVLED